MSKTAKERAARKATTRNKRPEPAAPPRFAFTKGFALGIIVGIPAIALTTFALAHAGFSRRDLPLAQAVRFTALFAGLAIGLTAGGVGRLAAQARVRRIRGGLRWSAIVGARTFGVASAGLVVIAIIPHGTLPTDSSRWGVIAAVGALAGSLVGALIGVACGVPLPLETRNDKPGETPKANPVKTSGDQPPVIDDLAAAP